MRYEKERKKYKIISNKFDKKKVIEIECSLTPLIQLINFYLGKFKKKSLLKQMIYFKR